MEEDGWEPFPARRPTDGELLAMQQHVDATRRPVENDLRAYRLNAAQEGRLAASLTAAPPTRPSHRSVSVPTHGRPTRGGRAKPALDSSPRGHGRRRDHSRSPEEGFRSSRERAARGTTPPAVASLIHAEQVLRPQSRGSRSSRSLPPPRGAFPPQTTEAIYTTRKRSTSRRDSDGSPKHSSGDAAAPRRRGAADRAVARSRSAPLLRRTRPEVGNLRSIDAPDRDKDRLIRAITDQVSELGRIGSPAGGRRQGSDHGWHIVVTDLERQLEEARQQVRYLESLRAEEKSKLAKQSSGVFVSQMAQMEVFYEEKLAEYGREVQQVEKVNSELRREASELRAMLQIKQNGGHGVTPFDSPSVRESVAECCFVNRQSRSPSLVPAAPLPHSTPTRSAEDSVGGVSGVLLPPCSIATTPQVTPQRTTSGDDALPSATASPPHGVFRATVSVMTPPPTAPSPISPWVARSQSAEGGAEPSSLTPNRQYLELVEKNALAEQLVTAKIELKMAKEMNRALSSGAVLTASNLSPQAAGPYAQQHSSPPVSDTRRQNQALASTPPMVERKRRHS